MQSTYLWVILHVKRKKLLILTIFTCFLILDKIQDGGQDDDHVWWRQGPLAAPPPVKYIPHHVKKIKGFPLKAKLFWNSATYQKLKGGSISPSPHLYQGGGMTLRVRPRVKLSESVFF